jgi:hypothetical protein
MFDDSAGIDTRAQRSRRGEPLPANRPSDWLAPVAAIGLVGALLIVAAIAGPGNTTTAAKNNAILAKMFGP